jgi:hypothetical protein
VSATTVAITTVVATFWRIAHLVAQSVTIHKVFAGRMWAAITTVVATFWRIAHVVAHSVTIHIVVAGRMWAVCGGGIPTITTVVATFWRIAVGLAHSVTIRKVVAVRPGAGSAFALQRAGPHVYFVVRTVCAKHAPGFVLQVHDVPTTTCNEIVDTATTLTVALTQRGLFFGARACGGSGFAGKVHPGIAGGVRRAFADAVGVVLASGALGARASGGSGCAGKLVAGAAFGVGLAITDAVGVVFASGTGGARARDGSGFAGEVMAGAAGGKRWGFLVYSYFSHATVVP